MAELQGDKQILVYLQNFSPFTMSILRPATRPSFWLRQLMRFVLPALLFVFARFPGLAQAIQPAYYYTGSNTYQVTQPRRS